VAPHLGVAQEAARLAKAAAMMPVWELVPLSFLTAFALLAMLEIYTRILVALVDAWRQIVFEEEYWLE